jgi:hypothetical protein
MTGSRSLLLTLLSIASITPLIGACGASGDKGGGDNTLDANGPGPGPSGETDSGVGFDVGAPPTLDAGGTDSTFDPDAACAAKSFGGQRVPLALAIVFDVSNSMNSGTPKRIAIAKDGVKKALANPLLDDVAVGLFRFGWTEGGLFGDGCKWDVEPHFTPTALKTGRTDLFTRVDALKAEGSTPTYGGLNAAYGWLSPRVLSKTAPYDGKTAVILVTDGAPTCGSYSPDDYIALVQKGRKATIDTFIIGLPGSDEHFAGGGSSAPSTGAVMSKMAANGTDLPNLPAGCDTDPSPMTSHPAKPCYFDMSKSVSVDALAAALENISKAAGSCEYLIPTGDPRYDTTHPSIYVTDGAGKRTEIPKCDGGPVPATGCWDWTDAAHTSVKLVGAGCDTMRKDPKSNVDLLLPCKVS